MQIFNEVQFSARNKVNNKFIVQFMIDSSQTLRYMRNQSIVLAGGAVRRMVENNQEESDYDLFMFGDTKLEYVEEALRADNYEFIRGTEHHREYVQAISGRKVQLITNWRYKDIADLFSFFDFTICQCAFDGNSLYFGDYSLFDIARKRLVINRIQFFHSSLRRMLKYGNQGYYACAGTLQTFLNAVAAAPKEVLNQEIKYVD